MRIQFSIYRGQNGFYYFDLRTSDGEQLLKSEGYFHKTSCKSGIELVRQNAVYRNRFTKLASGDGAYYFELKEQTGRILCTSGQYPHSGIRDKKLKLVKKEAPLAPVDDFMGSAGKGVRCNKDCVA